MAEYSSRRGADRGDGLVCPACRVDLVMSERQGIEIDYCPKCRGVWLDRGELDKIVERSGRQEQEDSPRPRADARGYEHRGPNREAHRHDDKPGYRRKSWLSEIFD